MISSNSNSFAYNSFAQTKVNDLISLLKDPDVQTFLKTFIDASIATSELNILKRITTIEEKLGIIESEGPTIDFRLSEIEAKVNTLPTSLEPVVEPPIRPVTKTQKRACALVSKLRKCKKRFLTSSEIVAFLKHEVSEDIKITEDTRNPREVKKEVIEKAAELFPDIQLSKKPHGRREVRILVS